MNRSYDYSLSLLDLLPNPDFAIIIGLRLELYPIFPFPSRKTNDPRREKLKLSDEKFKRRIETTNPVFLLMLDILQAAYDELHQSGGKPPDLSVGVL